MMPEETRSKSVKKATINQDSQRYSPNHRDSVGWFAID
jgi:hypothetical protein